MLEREALYSSPLDCCFKNSARGCSEIHHSHSLLVNLLEPDHAAVQLHPKPLETAINSDAKLSFQSVSLSLITLRPAVPCNKDIPGHVLQVNDEWQNPIEDVCVQMAIDYSESDRLVPRMNMLATKSASGRDGSVVFSGAAG